MAETLVMSQHDRGAISIARRTRHSAKASLRAVRAAGDRLEEREIEGGARARLLVPAGVRFSMSRGFVGAHMGDSAAEVAPNKKVPARTTLRRPGPKPRRLRPMAPSRPRRWPSENISEYLSRARCLLALRAQRVTALAWEVHRSTNLQAPRSEGAELDDGARAVSVLIDAMPPAGPCAGTVH
eukprot:SAG31_NODE_3875_length_3793_cov_1.875203_2_plen_183_part_00